MNRYVALALSLMLLSCSTKQPETKTEAADSPKQDSRLIEMGLEAQQHVGLQVTPVSISKMTEYLRVTGTIQPIDSRVAKVRPLAKGRITEVLVKVGDRVTANQILANFENIEAGELSSQYQAAEADLERAKVQLATAKKQAERNRRLAEIGAVPQKDVELSQSEQEALEAELKGKEHLIEGIAARLRVFGGNDSLSGSPTVKIRSPFAGVVTKAAVSPGELINADSELFQVADLSRVWVQAEVYEKDLGRLRLGQSAFIRVDTYPNETFAGTVSYVGDILDAQTRTAKVRSEVANPGIKLKLDMFATVDVPTTFSRSAIAVPARAIQHVEGKPAVFVRKADTKFELREVKTGNTVDGKVEIVSGLSEGEGVVTNGAFHLKSIAVGKDLGEEDQ